MAVKKTRLDRLLVARGLAENIDTAFRLIGAGKVRVNGQPCDKAGAFIPLSSTLELKGVKSFVSRGGDKLASALNALNIDPLGLICADIGASTGGFTDCLLQHGALRVYSVDVGYGILDWKLRQDARVIVLERTNARLLGQDHIPEPLDLAVIDASFISASLLLPPLAPLFTQTIRLLVLVKPQFQLPKEYVASGGVVHDPELRQQAVSMVIEAAQDQGLHCIGRYACPLRGAKGNEEIFLLLEGEQNFLPPK